MSTLEVVNVRLECVTLLIDTATSAGDFVGARIIVAYAAAAGILDAEAYDRWYLEIEQRLVAGAGERDSCIVV